MEDLTSFPSTDWSGVCGAAADDESGRRALAKLLERYPPALRYYLAARWKVPADRAADLVQGFIADKVLEDGLLRHARRSRGKFRSFIVKSLDRYVIDEFRKGRAGGARSLESDPDLAGVCDKSAVDPFEFAWARSVIEAAIGRMREECELSGRPDLWLLFEARVLKPALEHAEPTPYLRLQEQLNFRSPEQASNLLITAKRTFARLLRDLVREYVDDEAEVEGELRSLKQILSRRVP